MTRRLCFRFDVDSHRCLGAGTRALTAIAGRHDVAFTFYVHMGRATQRRRALREAARRRPPTETGHHLSSRTKLGSVGLARLLLANPPVGAERGPEIQRLVAGGHEVGLHGGRNHRTWQEGADTWDHQRVRAEMAWGRDLLTRVGGVAPAGFASPAWTTSAVVAAVAAELGFTYLADRHEPTEEGVDIGAALPEVVTNVLGEPGGVGYLEWARAQGWSDDVVVSDFRRRLERVEHLAVVYDHPFWAGLHDARLVDRLLTVGTEAGFAICTVAEAVERSVRP